MKEAESFESWLVSPRDEMHCQSVTRFVNKNYDEPLLYVQLYKYCEIEVLTTDKNAPKFKFHPIEADLHNRLGLNVCKYESENVSNIYLSALPESELSKIFSFPKSMDEAEKKMITEKFNDPELYGLGLGLVFENWAQDGDVDLWIWGDLEAMDANGKVVTLLMPES